MTTENHFMHIDHHQLLSHLDNLCRNGRDLKPSSILAALIVADAVSKQTTAIEKLTTVLHGALHPQTAAEAHAAEYDKLMESMELRIKANAQA